MATIDPAAQLVIREAREICAVAAPPFHEEVRAALVAERLRELGGLVRTDAVGNVIAELPGAAEPPVAFVAHLDTVFDAAITIAFRDAPERLYAPGIGDNSLGVASLLHLARHFAGKPLARSVLLVASVGEEGLGDLRGAKALVEEQPLHAFVAVEGSMAGSITVAAVGSIRFGLTVTGPGGHPWGDRERPSAVHAMVTALDAAIAAGGSENHSDADLVLNVGTIQGGTAVNAIASSATATLELRCEDDAVLTRAAAKVSEAMTAAIPRGLQATVEHIGHRPGGRLSADHPLLLAAHAARRSAGLPPVPETASSTDANAAHGRGLPAITVGITTGGDAHTTREYIDLPPIAAGLQALTTLADALVAPH